MRALTERQKEILSFVSAYISDNGRAPTQREVGTAFGFSHTAARDALASLERKGFIELERNRQRAIALPAARREEMENIPVPFYSSEPSAEMLSDNPPEERIFVQKSIRSASLFAFRVTSESMRNAGILPGDIAVMTHLKGAPKNDWIILASCSDDAKPLELRRFMRINDDFIQLCPENDTMGVIKASYASLTTAGVLCMIRRDYEPHPPRA